MGDGEHRPTVRPRVAILRSSGGSPGEAVLLEDALVPLVETGRRGCVALLGGAGSGRTTALGLAERWFGDRATFLDEPEPDEVLAAVERRLVVYTSSEPVDAAHLAVLDLSPWSDDDVLEHLLAVAPERCGELLPRLLADPLAPGLAGNPELWTAALDEMLAPSPARTLERALLRRVRTGCGPPARRRMIAWTSLAHLHGDGDLAYELWTQLAKEHGARFEGDRLVRHEIVRRLLARDHAAVHLCCGRVHGAFEAGIDPDLAEATGRRVAGRERARRLLIDRIVDPAKRRKQCELVGKVPRADVAILHAIDRGWLAELCARGRAPELVKVELWNARLRGLSAGRVDAPELRFSYCDLTGADFAEASIGRLSVRGSTLVGANLGGATFERLYARDADLRGARMEGVRAASSVLSGADLRGAEMTGAALALSALDLADLENANLAKADLRSANLDASNLAGTVFAGASLVGARLRGVDLRTADLTGADLTGASLIRANLESAALHGGELRRANLASANLTSTCFEGADMFRANLRSAGLADVRWRGADLRGADLTGASFAFGGTRGGLIPHGYPSQGTRTGFYTDERRDLEHKDPELVRRADLRDVNLHGAKVSGCDFYLVDLRGALLDAAQRRHLRKTGAIL